MVVDNLSSKFFSLFNRNAKIHSAGTAKSRRDETKRMSYSDSADKKNVENYHTHHLCISKLFFCDRVL